MSNLKLEEGTQVAATVPLFLKKLWKMVNDEDAQDIISWNSTGNSFIIHDPIGFVTNLLPNYFKHNNLASFVRQLNFYGFHKISTVDKDEMQFAHSYFLKDLPETLVFITRKATPVRARPSKDDNEADLQNVLKGVKELKGKHALIDQELQLLRRENSALWNEINCLRVKYVNQTKLINKLIHFLISYIHSPQNVFSKQNTGINRNNLTKNLNVRPLLEIDYKGRQPKSAPNKSTLPFILSQPGSSGAITYKVESSAEEENTNNVELLNSILKATDDESCSYTVQFPKSFTQKSPNNFEVLKETAPNISEIASRNGSSQAKKIKQLNKGELLEDIFQVKDDVNDKSITYSVKYPKFVIPTNAKTPTVVQSTAVSPKLAIREPINIIENRNEPLHSKTVTLIPAASSTSSGASDARGNTKERNLQILPKTVTNTPIYKKQIKLKPDSRKRTRKQEAKPCTNVGIKKGKTSSIEKEYEYIEPGTLVQDELPIDKLLFDANTNATNTIPSQTKVNTNKMSLPILPKSVTNDQDRRKFGSKKIMSKAAKPCTNVTIEEENNANSETAYLEPSAVDKLISDPNMHAINTIPGQAKKLDPSILDNPKENLGLYVENTESEINNLQDILSNLNAKDWVHLLQEISPLTPFNNVNNDIGDTCDEASQEEMNQHEDVKLNMIENDLASVLDELPTPEILEGQSPGDILNLSEENILNDEQPKQNTEILVDEYFNPDFEIINFPENV